MNSNYFHQNVAKKRNFPEKYLFLNLINENASYTAIKISEVT